MDSFACEAVRLFTDRTVKSVYIVLVHTPPRTVGCFAMEAVGSLTLCCGETAVQKLVEILR